MTKACVYRGVTKSFPGFRLGPLDLDLEPGSAVGLIGPNGSGKTTTIQCLVGLLRPDSGDITVFGRKNHPFHPEWKFDIGYVGDIQVFHERWTGERNLRFLSKFYPEWSARKVVELAERFRLPLDKRARDLSTGNRVKLSLVAALAHSPGLLLLDEPTSGVDPVARREILDALFEVLEDGERAILYATHILPEISRLVDGLVFLKSGRIRLRASKADLEENWRRIFVRCRENLGSIPGVVETRREGDDWMIVTADVKKTTQNLFSAGALDVREERLSLEEVALFILREENDVVSG